MRTSTTGELPKGHLAGNPSSPTGTNVSYTPSVWTNKSPAPYYSNNPKPAQNPSQDDLQRVMRNELITAEEARQTFLTGLYKNIKGYAAAGCCYYEVPGRLSPAAVKHLKANGFTVKLTFEIFESRRTRISW